MKKSTRIPVNESFFKKYKVNSIIQAKVDVQKSENLKQKQKELFLKLIQLDVAATPEKIKILAPSLNEDEAKIVYENLLRQGLGTPASTWLEST